ncbi:MAG: hypothetical protein J6R18_09735 [Kiritimatiellae bacterium]|nr:hypothetical protein [Kiritimatiellia bacterium]
MKNGRVIREEPGEYRMVMRYALDGMFEVTGESKKPITLTVRVEDAWDRIPERLRRYSYDAVVWRDETDTPTDILNDVAPDARILIDFREKFRIEFR